MNIWKVIEELVAKLATFRAKKRAMEGRSAA